METTFWTFKFNHDTQALEFLELDNENTHLYNCYLTKLDALRGAAAVTLKNLLYHHEEATRDGETMEFIKEQYRLELARIGEEGEEPLNL